MCVGGRSEEFVSARNKLVACRDSIVLLTKGGAVDGHEAGPSKQAMATDEAFLMLVPAPFPSNTFVPLEHSLQLDCVQVCLCVALAIAPGLQSTSMSTKCAYPPPDTHTIMICDL
jgi:hypothetical protein